MKPKKSPREKKIEAFANWLVTPETERIAKTQKDFAESIGVEEHTLVRWKAELARTDNENEVQEFKAHLLRLAMKPSATAKHMELYARLKGLLDKQPEETKVTSTAEEYVKNHLALEREARRRLREEGYGGAYDRDDIIGILEFALKEGIIDSYKQLPQDASVWRVFEYKPNVSR